MRYEHASNFGIISQDDFVQSNPEEEAELVAGFGSFTAEVVYLEKDLRCITMYCDNAATGIVGLCLHTSSKTHHVGRDNAMPKCFPLNGPSEVISEIDVRLCSLRFPLAIIVSLPDFRGQGSLLAYLFIGKNELEPAMSFWHHSGSRGSIQFQNPKAPGRALHSRFLFSHGHIMYRIVWGYLYGWLPRH